MILITGGAYQGKTLYAEKELGINSITDGALCGFEEALSAPCIKNYHLLIKRIIENGMDAYEYTEKLCAVNKSAVIIIDEIGCGIIPIEKSERKWREAVGKAGCVIARNAERVIRMNCGIAQVIK